MLLLNWTICFQKKTPPYQINSSDTSRQWLSDFFTLEFHIGKLKKYGMVRKIYFNSGKKINHKFNIAVFLSLTENESKWSVSYEILQFMLQNLLKHIPTKQPPYFFYSFKKNFQSDSQLVPNILKTSSRKIDFFRHTLNPFDENFPLSFTIKFIININFFKFQIIILFK